MDDNDDWESFKITLPNELEIKKIEEQKLVEKSDNELTQSLFSNSDNVVKRLLENRRLLENKKDRENKIQYNKKKIIQTKKQELQEKQKQFSLKLKEEKLKKVKSEEIFGQYADDEYASYYDLEDMYN